MFIYEVFVSEKKQKLPVYYTKKKIVRNRRIDLKTIYDTLYTIILILTA